MEIDNLLKTGKQTAIHHLICLLYAIMNDGLTYNIIVVTCTEMKVNYEHFRIRYAIHVSQSVSMVTVKKLNDKETKKKMNHETY